MQHLVQLPLSWYQPAPSMQYYMRPPPPLQTFAARHYLYQQPCAPSHLQSWHRPQTSFSFSLPQHAFPRYPGPVPDKLSVPELEPSSTPSEPGSPLSTLAPQTPSPQVAHVVCNIPLHAPRPLPYRPPTFLNSFELPDPDADLSRPPYTGAAGSKRKRCDEAQDEPTDIAIRTNGKRRATEQAVNRARLATASLNGVLAPRRFSC
jgi:hypothetical protein